MMKNLKFMIIIWMTDELSLAGLEVEEEELLKLKNTNNR